MGSEPLELSAIDFCVANAHTSKWLQNANRRPLQRTNTKYGSNLHWTKKSIALMPILSQPPVLSISVSNSAILSVALFRAVSCSLPSLGSILPQIISLIYSCPNVILAAPELCTPNIKVALLVLSSILLLPHTPASLSDLSQPFLSHSGEASSNFSIISGHNDHRQTGLVSSSQAL